MGTVTAIRIDVALEAARSRYVRIEASEAYREQQTGALLVDTRPEALRRRFGVIPGALIIDRNVLEWRLDPTSPDRICEVAGPDTRIILHCQEGYASSLAAAGLLDLGLTNVTDVVGGIRAWSEAGLPVAAWPRDEDS